MNAEQAESAGYDESSVNAYKQKDKLLQFDKENAERTHVHDAQGDYYDSGNWLSEQEKKEIEQREMRRREQGKKKLNKKINIHFDIAGRRTVEFVSDDLTAGDENDTVYVDTGGNVIDSNSDNVPTTWSTSAAQSGSFNSVSDGEFSVFENISLERAPGMAGDFYRSLKKRWDQQQQDETTYTAKLQTKAT